jgi:uncharacterized protein (TIGR02246 family)
VKPKAIMFLVLVSSFLFIRASPAAENSGPESVVGRFVQAWNAHDQNAIASVFAEDAYLVQNVNSRIAGRENIVADFKKAFETSKKTTVLAASDIVVHSLRPDVAVILFRTQFVGQEQPRAVLLVVMKQSEEWRVAALQITKPDLPHPAVRLKALKDMLDQKLISPQEYERKRKALIDGI